MGEWRGVNQALEGVTTSTMSRIRAHMDNEEFSRRQRKECTKWVVPLLPIIKYFSTCQNPDSVSVTEPLQALDQPQPSLVGALDRK